MKQIHHDDSCLTLHFYSHSSQMLCHFSFHMSFPRNVSTLSYAPSLFPTGYLLLGKGPQNRSHPPEPNDAFVVPSSSVQVEVRHISALRDGQIPTTLLPVPYLISGNQAKFTSGSLPTSVSVAYMHILIEDSKDNCAGSPCTKQLLFASEGPAVCLSSLELVGTLWLFKPCGFKLCLTADKQCLAGIHKHPFLGDAEAFTHLEQHLFLCPSSASLILMDTARPPLQTPSPKAGSFRTSSF